MIKLNTYQEFIEASPKETFVLFETRLFNTTNMYREPIIAIHPTGWEIIGDTELRLVNSEEAEPVRWSRAEDYSCIVQLEKHDMKRLSATCKSISKKLNKCSTVEDYAKLFAHGSQAQNLIKEFGIRSEKVDLSLDLMFAEYIKDRIFDEEYDRRFIDPEYRIHEDKWDHVTRYLVSGFNVLDYWKQYYKMVGYLDQLNAARTGYVNSFDGGKYEV